MAHETILNCPLHWPPGQARTPASRRQWGGFKKRAFGLIRDELLEELRRLGAAELVVSSSIRCRSDGLPYAGEREPADPGIAVYFVRRKKPYVIACDTYDATWKNLRAITLTIDSLRAIERHASTQMMEQAFTGFAALPPARAADPSWWETLGLTREATADQIEAAHRQLALEHHPDVGGDGERMAQINRARDVGLQERAS